MNTRPKLYKNMVCTMRPETIDALHEEASLRGTTKAQLLRDIVGRWMDRPDAWDLMIERAVKEIGSDEEALCWMDRQLSRDGNGDPVSTWRKASPASIEIGAILYFKWWGYPEVMMVEGIGTEGKSIDTDHGAFSIDLLENAWVIMPPTEDSEVQP